MFLIALRYDYKHLSTGKKSLLNRILQEGLVSAVSVGRSPSMTGNVKS